jgi:ribonuclease HII
MLIAGIDEAGRGPCLGPMVLAVATIMKREEHRLLEIGVRDSKQLNPEKREQQLGQLKGVLNELAFVEIEAEEIDSLRDRKSLNEIEAMRIGMLLNRLGEKPDIVYIDSPDVLQENFAKRIKKYISFETRLVTEHRADSTYPIVSAASIIAKVERDRRIGEIRARWGNIGSGYSHDPFTIKFLKEFIAKNKCLPSFARKSWLTSQEMLDNELQRKLGDFK